MTLTLAVVALALLRPWIASGNPFHIGSPPLLSPSRQHLFGTDNLGRDEFRSVVNGLRTTLLVVVGTTAISAFIGVALGATAGYYGGTLTDRALLRATEIVQTIPRFFLAILAISLFGATERNLIIFLGVSSWALLARIVRAESLSIRHRGYIEASRAAGSGDLRILARHVGPNIMPTAVVVIALNASTVILLEAGLSFIGLGDPNRVSLGGLITTAQVFLRQAWWMSVFPGAAIATIVVGINLIADVLNDILAISVGDGRMCGPMSGATSEPRSNKGSP